MSPVVVLISQLDERCAGVPQGGHIASCSKAWSRIRRGELCSIRRRNSEQTIRTFDQFVYSASYGSGRAARLDGRAQSLGDEFRSSLSKAIHLYYFDRQDAPPCMLPLLFSRAPGFADDSFTPALYGIVPPVPFDMIDKAAVDFPRKESESCFSEERQRSGEARADLARYDASGTFIALTSWPVSSSTVNTEVAYDIDTSRSIFSARAGTWQFMNLRLFLLLN
jgi:hypothetical protein